MKIRLLNINRKERTDLELVATYKKTKDNVYAGELYKRYTNLVFGVCMKYLKNEEESKDAVMLIFEKLLDDLLKFEIENFKAWLFQVVRNHCLMHLRKEKTKYKQFEEYEKDLTSQSVEFEDGLHLEREEDNDGQVVKLQAAIQKLNKEQQICIELFYIKGKSYQEVADQTGYPLKKVKSYIQNGKRNLKNYLS